MTIKTWEELSVLSNGQWPDDECMQAEIDELREENLKQDEEYVAQGLRLIQIEKRLDAWEKQEPVAWLITDDRGYFASLQLFKPTALLSNEIVRPLYTKPKEPS